jgi:hypothetical protein
MGHGFRFLLPPFLKKGGLVEKRGEEETKSMPHAPVIDIINNITGGMVGFLIFSIADNGSVKCNSNM